MEPQTDFILRYAKALSGGPENPVRLYMLYTLTGVFPDVIAAVLKAHHFIQCGDGESFYYEPPTYQTDIPKILPPERIT